MHRLWRHLWCRASGRPLGLLIAPFAAPSSSTALSSGSPSSAAGPPLAVALEAHPGSALPWRADDAGTLICKTLKLVGTA